MDNSPTPGDELDPLYCAVFKDSENGTPDNITQAGCLALARLGKEAWNAWRQKYPARELDQFSWENTSDFSGFDFREESIDFQCFVFDHGARFNGAQFGYRARFDGAQFGKDAHFYDSNFDDTASFAGALFRHGASFIGAQFGDGANFDGVQFDDYASFIGAQFGNEASFGDALFGDNVSFDGAQLGKSPFFAGAQFGNYANFDATQFGEFANFVGTEFGDNARFISLNWASLTNLYSSRPGRLKAVKKWAEAQGLSPEIFKSISFAGANFTGQIDFSGRAFEGSTSFGRLDYPVRVRRRSPDGNIIKKDLPEGHPVVFGQAPLFHNCKLHQDTTFDGAEFPPPSGSDTAARAYRTLKLAFAQQQATREEQRFFRLEMAEEVTRAENSQRWLFVVYKWASDYGFSLSLPMLWWLGFMLYFSLIYSLLADFTLCLPWQADCQIRFDLWQFTLLQALPLPGLDKWSYELRDNLFPKEGWSSVGVIAAVVIHKTISLLAVFLFGLALRNLFKMK